MNRNTFNWWVQQCGLTAAVEAAQHLGVPVLEINNWIEAK